MGLIINSESVWAVLACRIGKEEGGTVRIWIAAVFELEADANSYVKGFIRSDVTCNVVRVAFNSAAKDPK